MRDATHYARMANTVVPVERLAAYAAAKHATVPLDVEAATGKQSIEAVANHGRWIAECPDCHGALLVHPADRRFLCADCGNAMTGGKYRRVIWPKDAQKIADLLDARPDVTTQNWRPGETLADLRKENKVLGV